MLDPQVSWNAGLAGGGVGAGVIDGVGVGGLGTGLGVGPVQGVTWILLCVGTNPLHSDSENMPQCVNPPVRERTPLLTTWWSQVRGHGDGDGVGAGEGTGVGVGGVGVGGDGTGVGTGGEGTGVGAGGVVGVLAGVVALPGSIGGILGGMGKVELPSEMFLLTGGRTGSVLPPVALVCAPGWPPQITQALPPWAPL